ncbi:two-component sensor kinase yxdK [Bacillus cereus VD133]|uniref:histidine kinase n=1 Tax=Bacillus cereus VD133 TaxID=1053233 RepID=A0A9W5PL52_BACCE|nr:sensor histidine kinase [Bacillus cereus]EOO26192.1 two-component sensor kinase yxdK [Bacillus cereus VD133]
MCLFVKDHIPFICFFVIQSFVTLLIYWLDGYTHLLTALYSIFLGVCFLIGYLIYRYYRHRRFYETLSHLPKTLNESLKELDSSPVSIALQEVLEKQYSHCQQILKTWEHRNEEHFTFLNQWVHQMKTPLSVIELITQDTDDERLESISEEVDRMRIGLEMVLYMARLETFEQDFYVERVSLRKVVNEVIHENKRFFIRSYVYPKVKMEQDFTVETDRKWLRFILNQIVSNAIKYSKGSRENITISSFTNNGTLIIEIRDCGVGIPKADLPRVFQPFYTGENGRKFKESTGMGLYLVRSIIKKLGHDIEIESEIGVGTTVRIVLSQNVY